MKNKLKSHFFFSVLLGVFLFITDFHNVYAQDLNKNKVRLSVDYIKIINGEAYLNIKATSKVKKKTTRVSNIEVSIYSIFKDKKIKLGTTISNKKGRSKFVFKKPNLLKSDSTNTYNILVAFNGNNLYKKASKTISFKNATIDAQLIVKDSINYIVASLIDSSTKKPIIDEALLVQVQRLFMPYKIGKEFHVTDENGSIMIPIEEEIPGVDGNLVFEVVLEDSDDYGTIKALVDAPIGTPIIDESTFDKRTMWSPRSKTPIFLLVFPNLLVIGIWSVIVLLILNLFKISRS